MVDRDEGALRGGFVEEGRERGQACRAELEIQEARIADDVGVAVEGGDFGSGDEQGFWKLSLIGVDLGELGYRVVIRDGDEIEAGVARGFERSLWRARDARGARIT